MLIRLSKGGLRARELVRDLDELVKDMEQAILDGWHSVFEVHASLALYHLHDEESILVNVVDWIIPLIFDDSLDRPKLLRGEREQKLLILLDG